MVKNGKVKLSLDNGQEQQGPGCGGCLRRTTGSWQGQESSGLQARPSVPSARVFP
jgi:homoaconitase/3-isopropylmalate dehydratase large subunit